MKITATLLKAGVPTRSRRVYSKEVIKKVVDDFKPDTIFVNEDATNPNPNIDRPFINGTEKGKIIKLEQNENGDLIAEVELFDATTIKLFSETVDMGLASRGVGKADYLLGKGIITDYTLRSVGICHKADGPYGE